MAARCGADEVILSKCSMELFSLDTLEEVEGLAQASDTALLTALTEVLDSVDDENLSPFDMLSDLDLLTDQKSREYSPLKRLMCLSRSTPEEDSLCSTRSLSSGKTLPRSQLNSLPRSDGEGQGDGSFTLSPVRQDSCPENNLFDWEGLTLPLPVPLEEMVVVEDDVSFNFADLIRHMHPYCMAVSVENEEGGQVMSEVGTLLEVLGQGENGELTLAIPTMNLPSCLPVKQLFSENEQNPSYDAEDVANDSSELIVVDDDDENVTVTKAPVENAVPVTPVLDINEKDEETMKKKKKEFKKKSPSRRKKKKKKSKEQAHFSVTEGRVLRSSTTRKMVQEAPRKPEKQMAKEGKEEKILEGAFASTPAPSLVKPKEIDTHQTKIQTKTTTTVDINVPQNKVAISLTPIEDKVLLSDVSEKLQPNCSPVTVSSQHPAEAPKKQVPAPSDMKNSSVSSSVSLSPVSSAAVTSQMTPPVSEVLPTVTKVTLEPKLRSLSLEEYRRLRQQKKPAPVQKTDNSSAKWPSLPEVPKELPPIPCLPDPSPKDPQRANTYVIRRESEEVKPAWQPRGSYAPPTPEALLVPPAYMVSSSNKVSAGSLVPRPQKTSESTNLTQKPTEPVPNSVKESPPHQNTSAQPIVPHVPPTSSKRTAREVSLIDGESSLLLKGKGEIADTQTAPLRPTKSCTKTTTDAAKPATDPCPIAPEKITVISPKMSEVTALSSTQKTNPATLGTKEKPTTAMKLQKENSSTQELIKMFTREMGIEAADLASLLDQFERTRAKEEQCVPEVSGRAAAVGNSSIQKAPEKAVVERVKATDIFSTAGLTPPATPPHQIWKPLAAVALLEKGKTSETSKSSLSKAIQIEAQPLPFARSHNKPTPAVATVAPEVACMDHDYCLPNKGPSTAEPAKRWNVKHQSSITIKPIKQHTMTAQTPPTGLLSRQSTTNPVVSTKTQNPPLAESLEGRIVDGLIESSVLETPAASPAQQETESTFGGISPMRKPSGRSYRHHSPHSPSPRCRSKERSRGRSEKRSHRSPTPMSSCSESDSGSCSSWSRSLSPAKKRYRRRSRSSSSSSSSSLSSRSVSCSPPRRRKYSYSSSRSGSWSRSRSRSPQRRTQWSRSKQLYRHSYGYASEINLEEVKRRKDKAIEERRVVYVGKIRGTMTQKELGERFSYFGEIEECSLHFREHGDNYGFVTYYNKKDAFMAIENGSKMCRPGELPFDLCFGGRRQFCQASYSDLDSSRDYDPLPAKSKFHALDFDTLLRQAQQNLRR
ncbi:uncharacterized protein pprc1 [Pholidichthys leucotaenia]